MQSLTHPKIAVENKKDIIFLKQEIMKYAKSAVSKQDLSSNSEHVKEEVEDQISKVDLGFDDFLHELSLPIFQINET